jgi:hypothetical protein
MLPPMKAYTILCALALLASLSASAQEWQAAAKSDPLTGKSYTVYTLPGKFLTPPAHGSSEPPVISLRCDPTPWRRLSGRLLSGFLIVNTVIDLKNGDQGTVQVRLDDGKLQSPVSLEYSTDYQAIHLDELFVNNIIWGHMITHKKGTNPQVRKVVIGVQEHLGGQIVMQFDMPDATQVAEACGTEYK